MIKITDIQGFGYYMTEANLPAYYQSFSDLTAGAASYIKEETSKKSWIRCYRDCLLHNVVALRADQIYTVEEVR